MQQSLGALRHSSMLKVVGIGALIIVMLIPLSMTRGVIGDRERVSADAHRDIMTTWGQRQLVGGPVLTVPYQLPNGASYDNHTSRRGELHWLAEQLDIEVVLQPEVRYRGIHKVPVYTAMLRMTGEFSAPDTSGLGLDHATFDWSSAYFALPLTDAGAIRNAPHIELGAVSLRFEAGGISVDGLPPQIIAAAGELLSDRRSEAPLVFSLDVEIGGTDSLGFLPLSDLTTVRMRSTWNAPAFSGAPLPESRSISDAGFSASWRAASLGRALPSRWVSGQQDVALKDVTGFGVTLFQPLGIYQMTERASKYAVLFIGLTFVAFFLFEVLGKFQLHPLQYLLVGFANTLFFLLLLSLAEHIGFALAYLLSSVASAGMIGAYSSAILAGWRRANLIVFMLACLYGCLYLTLLAETYAMLAGALGLWVILGLIMYLTRGIDWYRWGQVDSDSANQADLFTGSRT